MLVPEEKKHKYCEDTLRLEGDARLIYLTLGERLYNIREERLYEPAWSSWHEYTMEFRDLSPSAISKIIKVYETFMLKYGYKPKELAKAGGWTKLYNLSVHVKTKRDAEKWLSLAEVQSRTDLEKTLVEAKTGVDMRECKHSDTFLIRVCRGCKERVQEIEP